MTSPTRTSLRVSLTNPQLLLSPGSLPPSVLQAIHPHCEHQRVYFPEMATGVLLMPLPGEERLIAPRTYYAIDGGAYCMRCGVPVDACERCGAHGPNAPVQEALHGQRLAAHLRSVGDLPVDFQDIGQIDDHFVGTLYTCPKCELHVFSGGRDTGRRES